MQEKYDEWLPESTKTNEIHAKNPKDNCFIRGKIQFVLKAIVVCCTD